jgi:hypothetical protein
MREAGTRRARLSFRIHCRNHAEKMLCFALTYGHDIKKFFPFADISLLEKKEERQTILNDSI